MESLFVLAIILGVVSVYRYFREEERKKEEEENRFFNQLMGETENMESKTEETTTMEETISTRQLVLNTTEHIGSKPEYTEDGYIRFEYQGVVFLMETADDCDFVNLIWPWCYSFNKFDIDEFARVRQVINDINAYGVVSVFYGDTDSDDVAVHVKKNFLFIQQIPNIEGYLRLMLDGFFKTVRKLDLEIEKMKMQEGNS